MMEQIITDTIESYNHYLKKMPDGCLKIAEFLRNNEVSSALKTILDFSEGASWLADASSLLQSMKVTVELPVSKIHEFLNEVNNGLEIQDYVLVADMFEYEIAPFFEGCAAIEA